MHELGSVIHQNILELAWICSNVTTKLLVVHRTVQRHARKHGS
jgi:hypothetical protein